MKTYTIPQFRAWLEGELITTADKPDGRGIPDNRMLQVAIAELKDPEDGIEAVTRRIEGGANTHTAKARPHGGREKGSP